MIFRFFLTLAFVALTFAEAVPNPEPRASKDTCSSMMACLEGVTDPSQILGAIGCLMGSIVTKSLVPESTTTGDLDLVESSPEDVCNAVLECVKAFSILNPAATVKCVTAVLGL